jgi:hypothetical protein
MSILKNLKGAAATLQCLVLLLVSVTAVAEPTGGQSSGGQSLFSGPQQQTTTRQNFNPLMGPDYPMAPDSYFTDDSGNILMYIKVIGLVNKQGPMIVREDVDFSEIMANAQGLKPNADLHKVLVARRKPDENGKQAYIIDLKKFYKYGDRTAFIALKPNDTIIFPEKGISIDKLARISSIIYPWASVYSTFERNN